MLVPGMFGIMGSGLVLGVVGAVVAAAIHMATRRGITKSGEPAV
jgi:hypothetical protein